MSLAESGEALEGGIPFDESTTGAARPIRGDLIEAHRRIWGQLAAPGTWWTGTERVALAAEVRAAGQCGFCAERRAALSPFSVTGEHDGGSEGVLPEAAVDAVHRLVTDPSRLSRSWVESLAEEGVPDTHYVELLSVVVTLLSIDRFHLALGMPLEPLPEARPGEPTRHRPATAGPGPGWLDTLPNRSPRDAEADLWSGPIPNVIRAMSLVPDAVRWLNDLSAVHYLPAKRIPDPTYSRGPLSRAQTELVAGRVSALNECFY